MKRLPCIVLLAAAFAMGCGSSPSDPATPEQDPSDAAAEDPGTPDAAGDSAGLPEAAAQDGWQPGVKVKVTYLGTSTEVDLNQPPLFQDSGYDYSVLSEVIAIAVPGRPTSALQAGFVAGDGYNPADNSGCAEFVPVKGDKLKQGWVDRNTRFLAWDPALGMPGCMKLKDLAEVFVSDL